MVVSLIINVVIWLTTNIPTFNLMVWLVSSSRIFICNDAGWPSMIFHASLSVLVSCAPIDQHKQWTAHNMTDQQSRRLKNWEELQPLPMAERSKFVFLAGNVPLVPRELPLFLAAAILPVLLQRNYNARYAGFSYNKPESNTSFFIIISLSKTNLNK